MATMSRAEAIAFGEKIKKECAMAKAEAHEAEIEMMLRQGYTRQEAENAMAVDAFNDLIARGYGKQHRTYKPQPCGAWL